MYCEKEGVDGKLAAPYTNVQVGIKYHAFYANHIFDMFIIVYEKWSEYIVIIFIDAIFGKHGKIQ